MISQIQSSVSGEIRKLLMVAGNENVEVWRCILLQMYKKKSSHTQIIVWANSQQDKIELADFLKSHKAKVGFNVNTPDSNAVVLLSPIDEGTSFTSFVRDPFFIFQGNGNDVSAINSGNAGHDSELLTSLIKTGLIVEDLTSEKFCFDGAEILYDKGVAIISMGAISVAMSCMRTNEIEVVKSKIASILNINIKNIHPMFGWKEALPEKSKNENWQQDFSRGNLFNHIDMYISMTGKNSKRHVRKPIILLGTIVNVKFSRKEELSEKDRWVAKEINEIFKEISSRINEISEHFKIIRSPLLKVVDSNNTLNFHFYNNCLVEKCDRSKTVWLPSYLGAYKNPIQYFVIKLYEVKLWIIWRFHLGFKVRWIKGDFSKFSRLGASLHCLTKEIYRIDNN